MKIETVEMYDDNIGWVRFEAHLDGKTKGWWVCLSDIAALFSKFKGNENFCLETWLGNRQGLENFIDARDHDIWGISEIAIELARVPQNFELNGLPLWIARKGRQSVG